MRFIPAFLARFVGAIMGGRKQAQYVADFETTTDPEDCRVWAYGLANINTADSLWDVEIGPSIHRFFDRMAEEDSVCYFHNLKFDGEFIFWQLFKEGYTHVKDRPHRAGQFSTLISSMGSFYSITVRWKNGKKTEFRDSLKKLPYSVAVVAKAFNQPEQKGELDYTAYRAPGHIPTAAERAYIAADVLIVARALKTQFDQGMTKLTVGSDSLAEFKKITGTRLYDKLFPVLPDEMDAEIRAAYRGGFTYADTRFRGKVTRPGITYDVNSLYPSVMYDRVLPYGEPIYAPGLPSPTREYPLFIVSLTFTAKLKPGHIPCIQVKGSSHFLATEYQTEITEPVTISCTSVDLQLWEDHYDLDILSYNGGWLFRGVSGLFTEFIDKWMDVKANNEGGLRALAKLQLNALYGKFGTNPNITPKEPVYDPDTKTVRLVLGDEETKDPIYTAMACFVTAYARDVTIRAAQDNYPNFAYADTDSLHLLIDDDPIGLDVDPHKLGAWKREYRFDAGLFVRAKAYIERLPSPTHDEADCPLAGQDFGIRDKHGEWCRHVTHVAGMPDRIGARLTIPDFQEGKKFRGKLQPKRVPGGIVLEDIGFTLKMS